MTPKEPMAPKSGRHRIIAKSFLLFLLTQTLPPVSPLPLLPTSRQNWFTPPPDSLPDEFEIIKPRLIAVYHKHPSPVFPTIGLPLPGLTTPYQRSEPQFGPSHFPSRTPTSSPNPSQTLLSFTTRDLTPFYAVLDESSPGSTPTTTSNPYKPDNGIEGSIENTAACRQYSGHLISPGKGYLALTTCPNEDDQLVMSATIMLTNGQVLLIRPFTTSRSPNPNLETPVRHSRKSGRAPHLRHSRKSGRALGRRRGAHLPRLKNSSNCYMSEYEKRPVSLHEELNELEPEKGPNMPQNRTRNKELLSEPSDSLDGAQNDSQEEPPRKQQSLVHQFGRHYLYRVSDKAPSIGNAPGSSGKPSNYSSCTERYIELTQSDPESSTPSSDNGEESSTYSDEDYSDQDRSLLLKSEHRLAKRDTALGVTKRDAHSISKSDIYSRTFTIETVIFADTSLLNRFNGNKADLQKLILAIMNEVQLIYNFDTLKIRVRILIKQIVYLEGKDAPSPADGDIDQYLDNFCAWQKRLWMEANRTARWDHALMLTGLDLYKRVGFKKNRKVLGLAWVNGMCRPAYSCTLNEGKNFEAAYVIAHEMAHSLGMLHDGYDNNCDPEKYIMSEKTGPGKINWSPCSNLYLENFLTKSNMRCLESVRADAGGMVKRVSDPFDTETDTRLPGEQYTLNQQCELALGKGYKAYISGKAPFNDVCRELWCSSGTWATPAHPALEGSTCGRRQSCYQGGCVDKQRAFAQSKIKMYNNRRPTERPSRIPSRETGSLQKPSNGAGESSGGGSFMRKVQRFLKSTIRSVVGFFG